MAECTCHPAYLGTATKSARGHSCPQQRSTDQMAWELAGARCLSELAADRNVRATGAVPTYAPGATGSALAEGRRVDEVAPRRASQVAGSAQLEW
jgi:hypothetical protein